MDMIKTGVFLQNLRKEKNFTQQELADYFHVSSKTVSKWECGKALPELPLLKEISEFYGVTVDEILSGERNLNQIAITTMCKEEIQTSYKKKEKMWSIFRYISFFVLFLAYLLVPIISIKNRSTALLVSMLVLFAGLFVYCLGIILSKLDSDVQSKMVLTKYRNQRINTSIWFSSFFLANFFVILNSLEDTSNIENIMNVSLTLNSFCMDTLFYLVLFSICGGVAQVITNYIRIDTKEKTKRQFAFIYKYHLVNS